MPEEIIEELTEEEEPVIFVIPMVYYYDETEKAYLYSREADRDNAESIAQGYFVPLVAANSTLVEIPEYGENQIPVFDETTQEWTVTADYRRNFKKVDDNFHVYDIKTVGEQTGFYVVTNEIAEEIKQNPSYFEIVDDEIVKKTDSEITQIELEKAKIAKIAENDTVRDTALNAGVTYQDVLFDSDTDQKVNLLAIVSTMDDEATVTWFGMYNDSLECTKADLVAIGGLIAQLHTFCWNKNAYFKSLIASAETVEEVEDIEIDYTQD